MDKQFYDEIQKNHEQLNLAQRGLRREFNEHIKYFKKHESELIERHQEYLNAQKTNTNAILQLSIHTKDMKDMFEAWNAINGAVKVSGVMGSFLTWLLKFSFIAGVLTFILNHLKET